MVPVPFLDEQIKSCMGPGIALLKNQADIAPGQETETVGEEVLNPPQLEGEGSGNQVRHWLWHLAPPTII